MKKIKDFMLRASNHALFSVAAFMVILGTEAITRYVVSLWHNEPEIPKSMLHQI